MADDTKRGLYRKFYVQRLSEQDATDDRLHLTDCAGCPVTPSPKHASCRYFVLDLEHDRFAGPALRAYAYACALDFPKLAADIRAMLPLDVERT